MAPIRSKLYISSQIRGRCGIAPTGFSSSRAPADPCRSADLIRSIAMTKFKSLLAASLAAVSLNAFAADWNMVSSSAEEQVFVDSQSIIKGTDNTIQVRILENFAHTNDMGQGVSFFSSLRYASRKCQ